MTADEIQSNVDDIKSNLMVHMAQLVLKCPSASSTRRLSDSVTSMISHRRHLAATVVGLTPSNDTVLSDTCSACKVVSGSFNVKTQDGGAADICGLSLQTAAYLKTLQGVTFQGSDQCSGLSYAGSSKADANPSSQKTTGPVVIAVVAFAAFAIVFFIVFKRRRRKSRQLKSPSYDTESEPESPDGLPSPAEKRHARYPPRVLDLESRQTDQTPSTLRTLDSA